MKKLTVLLSALIILTGAAGPVWAGAKKQFVNIGTASIGGSYYPTGGYICNVLNKSRKKLGHSIRCSVESTGGSVANLRSIQSGDLSVCNQRIDSCRSFRKASSEPTRSRSLYARSVTHPSGSLPGSGSSPL